MQASEAVGFLADRRLKRCTPKALPPELQRKFLVVVRLFSCRMVLSKCIAPFEQGLWAASLTTFAGLIHMPERQLPQVCGSPALVCAVVSRIERSD
jgi:hypothetical protein